MTTAALRTLRQGALSRGALTLVHWLFLASLVTGSADIAFNIELAGLNFRFSQLCQMALLFVAYVLIAVRGRFYPFPGLVPLTIWGLFLAAWIPNTYHLSFSVAYFGYFLLSYLTIVAIVQLYAGQHPFTAQRLFKAYAKTFVLIALFGLAQFALGIAGVDILITQWHSGGIPRINGLSYEPSYFATYMLIGWGMFAYLIERRFYLFGAINTWAYFLLISLALLLSSSRIGYLTIAIYFALYVVRQAYRTIITQRLDKLFLLTMVLLATSAYAANVYYQSQHEDSAILAGTGLAGTAAHSLDRRLKEMQYTADLIERSPIRGYSLGGVWSHISREQGVPLESATGMNITLEVLAASGIVGFLFFLAFIATIFRACRINPMLVSCGFGLLLVLVSLQFNQAIMRIYLWNHFAVIAALWIMLSAVSFRRIKSG